MGIISIFEKSFEMKLFKLTILLLFLQTSLFSQYLFLEAYLAKYIRFEIPESYPNLYYEINIASLNEFTEVELFYDETVQEYIDIYLNERNRQLFFITQKCEDYFPMFEKYLEIYHIPDEIKYLPIIESGMNKTACSPSKAVGLWQFKQPTGAYYGLTINAGIDEREDPESSTIAACKYFSYLYQRFNDWNLVLLAYNTGPYSLEKAIKKAGGSKKYADIYPWLSTSTQRYLPAYNAVYYLLNNLDDHFPQ